MKGFRCRPARARACSSFEKWNSGEIGIHHRWFENGKA